MHFREEFKLWSKQPKNTKDKGRGGLTPQFGNLLERPKV